MTSEKTRRLLSMQTEIGRRRTASQARFDAIFALKSQRPIITFVDEQLEQLHQLISSSAKSPIIVSFHTTAYFLLLELLDGGASECAAIVNTSILRKMASLEDDRLKRVRFSTTLTPDILREAIRGKRSLFIMADVFLEDGVSAPLPFRDQALRYTISWAVLAIRYDLPVVLCLFKDRGDTANVHIQTLPSNPRSPYHLAFDMFRRFEQCLGDDVDLWENYPAMELFGRRLPPVAAGLTNELIADLGRLSLCDNDLAFAISDWLKGRPEPC